MDERKMVLLESAYATYLESHLKLEILRDVLSKSNRLYWDDIIRSFLDIPEKEEKEC